MDRFDLHWPKTDASFLTDGQRCRIVWRSAPGSGSNLGGNIDNNALCKRRVADGLALAPRLLEELKARGYGELATEIEAMAGVDTPRSKASRWLSGLEGDDECAAVDVRRGKSWVVLGGAGDEVLELRPPAARGRAEWVLKRSWPHGRRKAEFLASGSLKGIFTWLAARRGDDVDALVAAALEACRSVDHPEAVTACRLWQSS